MLSQNLYNDYKSRTGARKLIDKMMKAAQYKQAADIDTFKQMYGIDGEIPKVY